MIPRIQTKILKRCESTVGGDGSRLSVVRGGLSQVVSRVVETKDFLRGNLKPALLACFRLIRSHWGLSEHYSNHRFSDAWLP